MKYLNVKIVIFQKTMPSLNSFVDGASDCCDNGRDAERVSSAILLLANFRHFFHTSFALLHDD